MSTVPNTRNPKIRTLVENPELVESNRTRLVDAATRLFRSTGFHATSTRDIAREAGVSVGAVYQYIKHKEDLLVLVLQSMLALHEARFFPLLDDHARGAGRLWEAVDVYYRILDEHHDRTHVLYHGFAALSRPLRTHFRKTEDRILGGFVSILEQGVASGEFVRPNVPFVAHGITAMGHMWALRRSRLSEQMTIDAYIEAEVASLKGLLLRPGRPVTPRRSPRP